MSFVIERKVGKRTLIYCGKKDNKPVYATAAECNRVYNPKRPKLYTRAANANRRERQLKRLDSIRYFRDCRTQLGTFSTRETKFYEFI